MKVDDIYDMKLVGQSDSVYTVTINSGGPIYYTCAADNYILDIAYSNYFTFILNVLPGPPGAINDLTITSGTSTSLSIQ